MNNIFKDAVGINSDLMTADFNIGNSANNFTAFSNKGRNYSAAQEKTRFNDANLSDSLLAFALEEKARIAYEGLPVRHQDELISTKEQPLICESSMNILEQNLQRKKENVANFRWWLRFLFYSRSRFKRRCESLLFFTLLFFFLLGFSACKNDEPVTQSIETPSLLNSKWRCLGFFDVEANEFRKVQRFADHHHNYSLEFTTDSTVRGYTSGNKVGGHFNIDYSLKTFEFTIWGLRTYGGELPDGILYYETMKKVQHFSFTDTELKLFYNEKKHYLLFESVEYIGPEDYPGKEVYRD